MATVAGIKIPKKKAPAARKTRGKAAEPSWADALTMSGEAYHIYRRRVFDLYYEDKKAADVFPDLIAWMKDAGYSKSDINRMQKHGSVGMVLIGIYARCLRNGMPDLHPEHDEYWQSLPGTNGNMQPITIFMRKKIDESVAKIDPAVTLVVDNTNPEIVKRTIQENMRDKTMEIGGAVDEIVDEFVNGGCKDPEKFSIMNVLRSEGCPPQTIDIIATPLKNHLAEITELMNPPTPAKLAKLSEHDQDMIAQLKEGYSHLGKLQIRAYQKFLEKAVADCASYVQVKKVERKPRAVKLKTPAQLARRFKYLKAFPGLGLSSVSPEKLVNGTEAWLYNTATRKLIFLIADDMTQTYTIKSNTLIGFDPTNSVSKTLRKPAEQLKALINGGKPANRKFFQDIKATEVKYNGRGNEHVVIVKAW
jgi:hypothetical protein